MNWLAKFTTGMLTAGILLSAAIEPVLAAKFTFEQGGFFADYWDMHVPFPDRNKPVDDILRGEFVGDDIDGDGILTLKELTSFSLGINLKYDEYLGEHFGITYDPSWSPNPELETTFSFSYNLSSGAFDFSYDYDQSNLYYPNYIYHGSSRSGSSTFGRLTLGRFSEIDYQSNAPIKIKQVSEPVAVPEPSTFVGLATLVVLSASSRVRRKFSRNEIL